MVNCQKTLVLLPFLSTGHESSSFDISSTVVINFSAEVLAAQDAELNLGIKQSLAIDEIHCGLERTIGH
jgi:hypothetical protein